MKRTGRCPKCESLAVASGGGGWSDVVTGRREYAIYVCLDCGFEERYLTEPRERGYELVRPEGDGPFRS